MYVKNLDESVTDETLQEVFGAIGALSSAVVMKDDEGKSKGFGFVNYEKSEDAHAAVEKLNGHKQGETEWEVTKAQKKAEREAELKAKFEKVCCRCSLATLKLHQKEMQTQSAHHSFPSDWFLQSHNTRPNLPNAVTW